MEQAPNGCDTVEELWQAVQVCKIIKPGIKCQLTRVQNSTFCDNARDFLTIATMKCWHERHMRDLPPTFRFGDQTQSTVIDHNHRF